MSNDFFVPGEEALALDGSPILGRLYPRSAHYTYMDGSRSSFIVTAHISGPSGANDKFEHDFYSIIFNDPLHIDIRTQENGYMSEYTDAKTGENIWERGEYVINGIAGFEVFARSQFHERFSSQEPLHDPLLYESAKESGYVPRDYRIVGEDVIHVITYYPPVLTPDLKEVRPRA